MIMLGAADPPALTAYADKIEQMTRPFTPACWALIYQAEARFRQEQLVQTQRIKIESYETAMAEGRSHPYDPLRPWNRVFEQAAEAQL